MLYPELGNLSDAWSVTVDVSSGSAAHVQPKLPNLPRMPNQRLERIRGLKLSEVYRK